MRLLVATHNAGKLAELRQMLPGVEIVGAGDLGLPEPEETEDTFLGNARIKAQAAARATGFVALADDSGLEVEALHGAPGVRTADWAETPKGRDFGVAMQRTRDTLGDAPEPWCARFVAVLLLAWPDGREASFTGTCDGHLVWPPRGPMGHGYDPMFVPVGETRTFAELTPAEKNARSHRGAALRQLVASGLLGA